MKPILRKLFESLSWSRPEEEQQMAIKQLIPYKDYLKHCLITETTKEQWDNAVKLIGELEYQDQVNLVPQMLILLQDMNWPGATEATKIMRKMNLEDIKQSIIEALIQADRDKDTIWITWINTMIKEFNIEDKFGDYKNILNKSEW